MDYSNEHNVPFNMVVTDAKHELLDLKREHCLNKLIYNSIKHISTECFQWTFQSVAGKDKL